MIPLHAAQFATNSCFSRFAPDRPHSGNCASRGRRATGVEILHVIGTATLIGGHLAVTARHVIEAVTRKFGARQVPGGAEVSEYSLRLYQVLPGPVYRIWNVCRAWICPSDIAILHLGLDASSARRQESIGGLRSSVCVLHPQDKRYWRSDIANQRSKFLKEPMALITSNSMMWEPPRLARSDKSFLSAAIRQC